MKRHYNHKHLSGNDPLQSYIISVVYSHFLGCLFARLYALEQHVRNVNTD